MKLFDKYDLNDSIITLIFKNEMEIKFYQELHQ